MLSPLSLLFLPLIIFAIAAMPNRQHTYNAAPAGTFQPLGNAGAAGAAVTSGGYQFPAGSGAQQPFAIGQPHAPQPNAAYQCPSRYMRYEMRAMHKQEQAGRHWIS